MGLWEDAQRSIPLIVSGHLFSSCIRQICSESIKGHDNSKRLRASSHLFTARAGGDYSLREGWFKLRRCGKYLSLWSSSPHRWENNQSWFISSFCNMIAFESMEACLIKNVMILWLRCHPRVPKTATVLLKCPDVQQESVLFWTGVDAVKFVLSSSLKTAARHSHVTTQRDWSATLEVDLVLLRESVEVQWLNICCGLFSWWTLCTCHLTTVSLKQLN